MKFLVLFSLIAVAAAAESEAEEQPRDKRGVLGLGYGGIGYPSLGYGYAAPLALHAPVAKVIAPAYHAPIAHLPVAKVIAPAYPAYAKVAYPSPVLPAYGLGYGHGYGYGHGLGLGYGYGGLLH